MYLFRNHSAFLRLTSAVLKNNFPLSGSLFSGSFESGCFFSNRDFVIVGFFLRLILATFMWKGFSRIIF